MATAKDLLVEDIENLALHPKVHTTAQVRPTAEQRDEKLKWKRNAHQPGKMRKNDFTDAKDTTVGMKAAVFEAMRCLKCADAPCQKGCPTSIDIKMFMQCISSQNYYGAAKIILSDNPVGLSCGLVCPTEDLCAANCNLAQTEHGAINISGLQAFAVDTFRKMRVKQIRPPTLPPLDKMPASYDQKIAIVGCGPAGISCATFLGRLGYKNVHIYEKQEFGGGLSTNEIPQYRLNSEQALWEVQLMKDLGVQVFYNKELGKDFTIESLRKEGYIAVFSGVGLPEPNLVPEFHGLTEEHGFFTSKSFLPLVAKGSKPGLCSCQAPPQLPKLYGKVLVLGAGDTAFDCTGSAFRCGASRVIVTFRRSFADIRAVDEEFEFAKNERTEFLPYCAPKQVLRNEAGHIVGIEMYKMDCDENGKYFKDEDQTIRIKCDFIISAFGSETGSAIQQASAPLQFSHGIAKVNPKTMEGSVPWLFAGGDLVGSKITVEATNDGKTASWFMHKYLQKIGGGGDVVGDEPKLPMFYTEIDQVDISVDFCGVKFPNPFGIASASGATSAAMLGRAFDAGWGFVVTKTFVLDKDFVTNVSPRIIRGSTSGAHYGPHQGSFMNIELISEKSAAYWCSTIRQLKKDHPGKVIVASIMCGFDENDWKLLTQMAQDAGPDMLELNLSCPHGMGEKGMGLACGQDPELVQQISEWVASVAKIPFFPKMTPNITEVALIAAAAKKGGATGVTAVNTVSSLQGMNSQGIPWPHVGDKKLTTFGGMSGNAVRPIALRAVSQIARKVPDFPIMATGGADSAYTAIHFLHCGAHVVQICSAVQNQDYSVVQDYILGLKTHLFMQSRSDLQTWDAQYPQTNATPLVAGSTPKFGKFLSKRWEDSQKELAKKGPVAQAASEEPEIKTVKVPTVNDIVGKSVSLITSYNSLDNTKQVVASVNDELCLNCGKCMMVCNDSGYQAIQFNPQTHQPFITDNCTGCTLCYSVCPVPDCITMVPRVTPHKVKRGVPFGQPQVPVA